jgi:hypothetical protein
MVLTSGYQPPTTKISSSKRETSGEIDGETSGETSISGASRRMSASLSSMSVAGTQLYQDDDVREKDDSEVKQKEEKESLVLSTRIYPSKQTQVRQNGISSLTPQNVVDEAAQNSSSPRAKQFLKELNDLHELLEHVKETANFDNSTIDNAESSDGDSDGGSSMLPSPAHVHVHRSGSIDVSVYNRSGMMSEINGAAMDNKEKDKELTSLLGSVRSKLNQLRSTIGKDSLQAPSPRMSSPPQTSSSLSEIPEPGTPGVSLDMHDLINEEVLEKTKSKRSIGRPPQTKSSMLREKMSHGQMKKPESSFIFPKSATKIQRNRRDSFMKSSELEQQWTAGRMEKRKDSNLALALASKKTTSGSCIPPPHVQRRMQRRAMGLPNRHQLQNEISGWTPPLCGYSSFNIKGAKFGGGGGNGSTKTKRKKGSPPFKKNRLKLKSSSPVRSNPATAKNQYSRSVKSGSKNRKNAKTENGEFEIVFSRELHVRIVKLRQVVDEEDIDGEGSEKSGEKGGERKRPRIEIAEQKDSIVHCRILLSRKIDGGGLKTVRVLLTQPEEDVFFHFRHFADQQLFNSIKDKLKLDVSFNDYPQTLSDILESSTIPTEQTDLILAIHSDGRARLQAMKLLFSVRKVEILSLNFLQSPEEVVKEYANGLNLG